MRAAWPVGAARDPARATAALGPRLFVGGWPDAPAEGETHDARSIYVETFWLGILGPSTTFLLRLLAATVERPPHRGVLEVEELARRLGVGHRSGANSPLSRSLQRLQDFGMARHDGQALLVRRLVPTLSERQVAHLPEGLRAMHGERVSPGASADASVQRARRLALSLVRVGEDPGAVEAQLLTWRVETHLVGPALAWALARSSCEAR